MTPTELVQAQLEAYNARDLPRFLSVFSDDVVVYRPPQPEPVLVGRAAFAEFYATQRFNHRGLRAELLNRIAMGDKVFDHERIHGVRDEAFEMVVMFEVREGLIRTVLSFPSET